jgi:hypothetical protein
MSPKEFRGGYIAIARGIFDHHLFREGRKFSRLEAWEWLIKEAAWKPMATRTRRGAVHLERGQLAVTVRDLGKTWGWPRTNTARFLLALTKEGMIGIKKAHVNAVPGTVSGTAPETAITIISVCKYDEFQLAKKSVGQKAGQSAGQWGQEALPFQSDADANQHNHSNQESREEAAERFCNRRKPVHCARSRDGKRRWFDHGTSEWTDYAAEYEEITATKIFPVRYIGGRGNWFLLDLASRKRRA